MTSGSHAAVLFSSTTRLRAAGRAAALLLPAFGLLAFGHSQQTPPPASQAAPAGQTAGEAPAIPAVAVVPMTTIQTDLLKIVSPLTQDEQILQVLNRLTYGPRPGDLERVRAEGISKWLGDQFNPQRLDDSALNTRLAEYPAMQLPVERMMEEYPNNAMLRAVAAGKVAIPSGAGERTLYTAQMDRYKDKKNGNAKVADPDASAVPPLPQDPQTIAALPTDKRFALLSKLSPAQLRELRTSLPQAQRETLMDGFTPRQVEVLAAFSSPQAVIASELVQTKLLRSIYSERQLEEVMVDFWLNHFNVYIRKNQQAPYFIAAFERDTIRPHALGTFEHLLVATAMSPAMLSYLDNASSVGPDSDFVRPVANFDRPNAIRRKPGADVGLNENYARELMELHTLGVNGGYTQQDVTEVAKVFTGWTIGRGHDLSEPTHVEFDARKHEPGDKTVLGVKIKQNGDREGLQVLHILATSPQTARFISTKLAVRFVSDNPPPALIERMTAVFLDSHGDIRKVLLSMVTSPNFFTRDSFRAKVKTPQDYVISAVRASGADVHTAGALTAVISDLGMPLYGMQTPNGYSMRADPWNSSASLVARMNFALALSTNRVAGVHTDWPLVLAPAGGEPLQTMNVDAKEQLLDQRLLHVPVSDRTRDTIVAQMSADPDQQRASLNQVSSQATGRRDALSAYQGGQVHAAGGSLDPQTALGAGLLFGSPEFQRR